MIAIATVTLDRLDLARRCLGPSLDRAGCDFRFYTWDNGSHELVGQYAALRPECVFAYASAQNVGYAPAVNQMMLRAYDDGADYFMVLDPDIIIYTQNWLSKMVETVARIPDTGVAAIYCKVFALHELQDVGGVQVHAGSPYGPKMWTRKLIEEIGYLCEDYGVYGNEDCDWLHRCQHVVPPKVNYYVPGIDASHEGNDVGSDSEYRRMKWAALATADKRLDVNCRHYDAIGNYFVPAPPVVL